MSELQKPEAHAIIQALTPLTFLRLRVTMEALEPLHLPSFKGSTLRGAFGMALRQAMCSTGAFKCRDCSETGSCVYHYVFETPIPEQAARMRKYTWAPHPFVLEPPLDSRTEYAPGDPFEFGLVLVGRAIELLPYFVLAFRRMGQRNGLGKNRGRLRLLQVVCEAPDASSGGGPVIYSSTERGLYDGYRAATINDLAYDPPPKKPGDAIRIGVRFDTPCRLIRGAALTDRPDFHVLFRSLLRRLSSLAYFHCGSELNLDFRALVATAEQVHLVRNDTRWLDWERYSARQDVRMNLGGIVGEVEYEGNLTSLIPLLRLGEVLHVGKGTGFGLGRYTITPAVVEGGG